MPRLNTIDLNRSFMEIAVDLGQRGKQELRAKTINGKTVLYSKKVSTAQKLVGNLFFDRAAKRNLARDTVLKSFDGFPEARRQEVLKNVPTARHSSAYWIGLRSCWS